MSTPHTDDSDDGHEGDDSAATKRERERVAASIRQRTPLSDRLFDQFLPRDARVVSAMYWTPLVAAVRAAQWFEEVGARRVLDIGSGAGKLCVAAALASRPAYAGVEHREALVHAARRLAQQFDVADRVTFFHQSFTPEVALNADAYYLYNPFGENLFQRDQQLDGSVELSDARYLRDVAWTEEVLRRAAVGTHLITFSGFGGFVPRTYTEVRVDWTLPSVLRMWRKINDTPTP